MLSTMLDIKKDAERSKSGFHSQGAQGCSGGRRSKEVPECTCRASRDPEGGGCIWLGCLGADKGRCRDSWALMDGRDLSRQRQRGRVERGGARQGGTMQHLEWSPGRCTLSYVRRAQSEGEWPGR